MAIQARFAHTSVVALNARKLAEFYERVLGCILVPPPRELSGHWLQAATGIADARVRGVHVRLPGHGTAGPTLEIFEYDPREDRQGMAINRPGLAHIAFEVDDVEDARQAVLLAGGRALGKTVSTDVAGAGRLTFVYVTDPEGNIIELQKWESQAD